MRAVVGVLTHRPDAAKPSVPAAMDSLAPVAYSRPPLRAAADGTRSGSRMLNPTGKIDASIRLFHAHPQGDSGRSGDRVSPADAARGHDPAGERRDLFVASTRLPRAEAHRADCARG